MDLGRALNPVMCPYKRKERKTEDAERAREEGQAKREAETGIVPPQEKGRGALEAGRGEEGVSPGVCGHGERTQSCCFKLLVCSVCYGNPGKLIQRIAHVLMNK